MLQIGTTYFMIRSYTETNYEKMRLLGPVLGR